LKNHRENAREKERKKTERGQKNTESSRPRKRSESCREQTKKKGTVPRGGVPQGKNRKGPWAGPQSKRRVSGGLQENLARERNSTLQKKGS